MDTKKFLGLEKYVIVVDKFSGKNYVVTAVNDGKATAKPAVTSTTGETVPDENAPAVTITEKNCALFRYVTNPNAKKVPEVEIIDAGTISVNGKTVKTGNIAVTEVLARGNGTVFFLADAKEDAVPGKEKLLVLYDVDKDRFSKEMNASVIEAVYDTDDEVIFKIVSTYEEERETADGKKETRTMFRLAGFLVFDKLARSTTRRNFVEVYSPIEAVKKLDASDGEVLVFESSKAAIGGVVLPTAPFVAIFDVKTNVITYVENVKTADVVSRHWGYTTLRGEDTVVVIGNGIRYDIPDSKGVLKGFSMLDKVDERGKASLFFSNEKREMRTVTVTETTDRGRLYAVETVEAEEKVA